MAWVIALGLSAGYLINKQMQISQRVSESVKAYEHERALPPMAPTHPAGIIPTTSGIRKLQGTVEPAVVYDDINNTELNKTEVSKLLDARESAADEVERFETQPGYRVQGVLLNYDRGSF